MTGPADGATTALVVDELPLVRRGLAAVLADAGLDVIAETHSGREAVRLTIYRSPALVVVGSVTDLRIDDLVRRLKAVPAPPRVLGLLPGPTDDVRRLVRRGIDGLAMRSAPTVDLTRTVRRVLGGAQPIAAGLLTAIGGRPANGDGDGPGAGAGLSGREREVLGLLAQGWTNRKVAEHLFVSEATVKSHVARIYGKLGAHNRAEALAAALARGLLE